MSTKRRMPASSGYIGAGNRSSVFNRKPKVAFEKLKTLYEHEISKNGGRTKTIKKLTDQERRNIKMKIRKQMMVKRYWDIFYGIIAILITVLIFYWFAVYVR